MIFLHELEFDGNGVAYKNGVRATGAVTKYYLVETKAPDGYSLLDHPIPVELTISDIYTVPVEKGSTPATQTTKPSSGLYNWEQKAKLEITESSGVLRTTGSYDPADESTNLSNTGIEATSIYEVMYYRIANNPGVELPHAGGIGTTIFYILGSILAIGSAIVLISRRRLRRN